MIKRMILPGLFGLLGGAFLIWLGLWQVERLAWKETVLAGIDAEIGAAPVALPEAPDPERDRFLPVWVEGEIGEGEIRVLASIRLIGPIYRIIREFETDAGQRILVDMGYVRDGGQDAARPGGPARLVGNLYWPDEVDGYTPEPDLSGNIWFARDVGAMADWLDTDPVLVVLRDWSENDMGVTPFPIDSSVIPNDHLAYAITWFLLAAVWLGMTAFLLWRISRRPEP